MTCILSLGATETIKLKSGKTALCQIVTYTDGFGLSEQHQGVALAKTNPAAEFVAFAALRADGSAAERGPASRIPAQSTALRVTARGDGCRDDLA